MTDVNDVPGLISQDVCIVGTGAAGDQGSGLAQHWQGLSSFVLMLVVLISVVTLVLALVEVMSPSLLLPTQYFWPDVPPQSLGRAAPDDFYLPVDVLHPPSHPVSQGGCRPEYILQLPPLHRALNTGGDEWVSPLMHELNITHGAGNSPGALYCLCTKFIYHQRPLPNSKQHDWLLKKDEQ